MNIKQYQILVFVVLWITYATYYTLRKPLGIIKADLETTYNLDKSALGWLDMALLLPYAGVQMAFGGLGDRLGPRYTLVLSLISSGLVMVTFGLWDNYFMFFILLALNGASQSLAWPAATKAVGSWFSGSARNTMFGIYGTSAFIGGIIGTTSAVYFQNAYGWRSVFIAPSIFAFVIAAIVALIVRSPEEKNITIPGKDVNATPEGNRVSLVTLMKLPMMMEIAFSIFLLKLVRYCIYMWMPLYLLSELHYSKVQAGLFSTMFEIGGVAGSAVIGVGIDRYFNGNTALGCAVSIGFSALSLLMFNLTAAHGIIVNSIFMALAGACNGGPDSLLGGALPAQIGDSNDLNAASAAIGLVNGFGNMGAILEGPLIGYISHVGGFTSMFYLIIVLSFISAFMSMRAASHHKPKSADHITV